MEFEKLFSKELENIWIQDIRGTDFLIVAIGKGLEFYSKYVEILDFTGKRIELEKYLIDLRQIAINFILNKILSIINITDLSPLTLFYILWRWNFKSQKVPFDEARKLAQGLGIKLENEWNKGFIKKDSQYILVLGPDQRKIEEIKKPRNLIDVLHISLILWSQGKSKKLKETLILTEYGPKEIFYTVAESISSFLPLNSKEKKLIDGFLIGKEELKRETNVRITQ